MALSLRMLCGLSTAEVAKAFLVKESGDGRAHHPSQEEDRVGANPVSGSRSFRAYVAASTRCCSSCISSSPPATPRRSVMNLSQGDLVERSLDLARMLHTLLPDDAEVASLLALILLTDSRRSTRLGPDGEFLALADQDRSKWHRDAIDEGLALVGESIRRGRPGRFTLMAAIAAVHSSTPHWDETDWTEIVGLYDLLLEAWPSPVVALNRAVAVSFADGPLAGLEAIDALSTDPQLSTYPYLAAARGDCLERLGPCR